MPKVVVQNGSHAGKSFDLVPAGTQVGRVAPAVILLAEPSVSSRHAKIWKEGNQWMLVDLGSTNGTLLNGAICERSVNTPINDGDKISFGAVILKVVIESTVAVTGGSDNKQGATMGPGQISGAEILDLAKKKAAAAPPPPVAPPPPPAPPPGLVAAPVGAYASEGAPVRSYENEIAVLKEEIAAAEQAAVRAREEAAQARAALASATAPVTALQAEVAALQARVASMVEPQKAEAELRAAEEKLKAEHDRALHAAKLHAADLESKANRFESELQSTQRQLAEARTAADESFTFQMAKQMAEQRAVIAETERDELVKRLSEVFAKQKAFDATLAEKDAKIAELAANQAGPAVTAPPPFDPTPLNDRIAALELELARAAAESNSLRDELGQRQSGFEATTQGLRERIGELEAQLTATPPPVDTAPLEARIAELETELARAADQASALNERLGQQQSAALDEADALRARITELEQGAATAGAAAGAAGDRTAALEAAVAGARETIEALNGRLHHAEALAAGESQRAAANEAQLIALSQEAEALRAAAEEQLAALRSDLVTDRQALAAAAARNVELEGALAAAQQSLSQAGEAAQLLGAERMLVEELRGKLAQADVELQAARGELARVPSLESAALEADRLRARLAEVEVSLESMRGRAGAAGEVEPLRQRVAELEAKLASERESGARDTTQVMETLMRERSEANFQRNRVAELEAALHAAQAAAVPSASPEQQAQLATLAAERDEAVAALAAAKARADQLDFKHRALMLERAQSQEDISRLQRDYAKLMDEMEVLKTSGPQAPPAELAALRSRLEDADARLAALQTDADQARSDADRSRDLFAAAELETSNVRNELEEVRNTLEGRLAQLQAELEAANSRSIPPPGADPAELAELATRAGELQVALADARADAERAQERLDELRAERQSLLAERDALRAELDAAPAPSTGGGADEGRLYYAHAQGHVSREIALAALDRINGDLGLLRRNAEILRGYVADLTRLAQLLESIDPAWLPPDAAPVLQQAVEEIQPSSLVQGIEGIAQESSEAASRAKGLVLDGREALVHEDEVDLERALSKSQRLASLVHDEEELPVELPAGMLPPLAATGPEGVAFGWALRDAMRHAKSEGGAPNLRLAGDESGVQLHAGPVPASTAARVSNPSGDAKSGVLHGFPASQGGSFDVREGDDGHAFVFSFVPKR